MAAVVQWAVQGLIGSAHYTFTELLRPGRPELGMLLWPHVAYWLLSSFYGLLDYMQLPVTQKHKLVRKEPGRPTPLTLQHVVCRVLVQQLIQAAFNICLFMGDPNMCSVQRTQTVPERCVRFVLGMFVMDAWQYWIHRYMHTNTFFYKHLHSVHHKLMMPYACGALYNSLLEGFILDTVGGGLCIYAAGMDCRTSTSLFTFATIKTVLDHSNYRWPLNPLHDVFPNSAAFHDTHHDLRFIKMNFSQPFFTHWDYLLGTFVDPEGLHYSTTEQEQRLEKSATVSACNVDGKDSSGGSRSSNAALADGDKEPTSKKEQ